MTRFALKNGRVRPPMFRNFLLALSYSILLVGGVGMTNSTSGQEPVEERIAALKEKLQLETQAMKRHLAELIEADRKDEAEVTERQLAEFQRNVELQIRELRGDRPSENKQSSQKQDEAPRTRTGRTPKRRGEQQENREAIERGREPNQRESNNRDPNPRGNEPAPEAERHVRELYEQLTQAIKQRQPERVVELSHQIAHHLREPQNHEPPQRERSPQGNPRAEHTNQPRDDQRREDRPRNDGPQHNGPQHNGPQHNGPQHDSPQHNGPQHNGPQHNGPQHNGPSPDVAHEIRMMVQELRGELQQLRRELDELRRERH